MTKNFDIYNYVKENSTYLLCLFLFSIFFVVDYSTSTSFIYKYPETCDSFIFQVIGKYWLEGSIPYTDLHDNKGPFLYAMNALGYWFTGNKTGLLIVQIPFFFADSIITFQFLQIGFNKKLSFWLTIAILLGLSLGYSGGNHGCEYSLPFIMLSFYLFYKWKTNDKQIDHPYWQSYIYGLTIGFCLMTRPSNALAVSVIVAYVLFLYLIHHHTKELFAVLLFVIAGCLTICLPFILYFWAKGSLGDLYYSLVISNLHYLKNIGLLESPMYLKRAIALLCGYINCLMFVIIGVLQVCINNGKRENGLLWLTISVVCIAFFVRTNCYLNYAHICLPFAAIGLLELKTIYKEEKRKRILSFITLIAFCIIGVNTFNGIYSTLKFAIRGSSPGKALYATYDELFKEIPKEGYESFIGYECPAEMYLRWDIRPCYRFFTLQGFSSHYNHDVYEKTNKEFVNGDAQWILINYNKGLPNEIKDTIKNRYQSVKEISTPDVTLVLYKLQHPLSQN